LRFEDFVVNRTEIVLAVVVVVVAGMLLAGRFLTKGPDANLSALRGSVAPDFALQSLDGKTIHLSDYKGKAVLLNFWATWCQPCKIEMPWFTDLQKKYGPEGLAVIGVAMDDAGPEDIGKFAKELHVEYPILLGKESVGEAYGGLQFLPATFYIDRNGKIIDRVFGLKSRAEIEENIKKALGPGQTTAQARP
jgi:peroxiredoxin